MSVKYKKKKKKVKSLLSKDLGQNMKFATLDLSFLNISDINEIEGLDEIPNLQVLNLSNNNISEIKGLENLTSLLKLNLESNIFFEIKGLENFRDLKILKLAGNGIIEIKGLENLKKLEQLEFGAPFVSLVRDNQIHSPLNSIKYIKGLEKLENLRILDLSYNQISKIEGLENLTELKYLDLNSNNIQEIKGLSNLKKLTYLSVYQNPIYKWTKNFFKVARKVFKNPQELVNYCRNKLAEEQEAEEMKRLVEEKRTREIIEITNILKEILQYEKDNKRTLTKTELIRTFKLSIDEAEKYFNISSEPIEYKSEEIPMLKNKAEQVLQELESPTLYDLINELDYDYETAKKLSEFFVDEGFFNNIPRIPLEDISLIHQKERSSIGTGNSRVFLSYSTKDTNYFRIRDISKVLESYSEIDEILYWEANSGENIVEYMEKTLKDCNVFVLFCSENSINSKAVTDEWQAAFQLRKKGLLKIVPVYEDEKFIPALLTPLLNVQFSQENFIEFIVNLYKEILRD